MTEINGSIYKIVFPNGKHYIGLTIRSPEERWKQHIECAKQGKNTYCIYNAMNKFGIENLKFEVIDTASTMEELKELEKKYIQEYNSYYRNDKGYNMTYGGDGTEGYKHTENDKAKMSEHQKQYHKDNPEARIEHGKRHKQYFKDNPEVLAKMSERTKQYYKDNPQAAVEHGKRHKQYWKDNPEAKVKNSERMKQYYKDNPEVRIEQSERRKQYFKDNPQAREKGIPAKPFTVHKDGELIGTFTHQFYAKDYIRENYGVKKVRVGEVLTNKFTHSHHFVFKYT